MLRDARYQFEVDAADIDESDYPAGMLPAAIAVSLAEKKARAVAERHPDDAEHAKKMLQLLSGTTHLVITGVCVVRKSINFFKCVRVMSAVRMRMFSNLDIERYVATNDWQGKAGGYGIQDADPFVVRQA